MDENIAEELRVALNLLRAGKTKEARPILVRILKTNPETLQAWYMLSFVVSDRQKQIYALQQIIQLDPNHDKATTRLAKILASQDDGEHVEMPETKDSSYGESNATLEMEERSPKLTSISKKTETEPETVAKDPIGKNKTKDIDPDSGEISASTFGVYEGPKRNWKRLIRNVVIGIIVLGAGFYIVIRGIDFVAGILEQPDAGPNVIGTTETPEASPTSTIEGGGRALPPTWTPSPTSTATPTATVTPIPTITETPSS